MNENDDQYKKYRQQVDAEVKQLSMANYEGKVKAIAFVYIDDADTARTGVVSGPNMELALIGALNLLLFEISTDVRDLHRQIHKGNKHND